MDKLFLKNPLIVRSAESISSPLDSETVILNLKDGIYSGLNPSGTTVWDFISTPKRFQEIVSHLSSEYNIDLKTSQEDAAKLLTQLLKQNLIYIDVKTPV